MIDGSELPLHALVSLAKNQDLARFLSERVDELHQKLLMLDCVEQPQEIVEIVRKIQLYKELVTEISDYGEAAADALKSEKELHVE